MFTVYSVRSGNANPNNGDFRNAGNNGNYWSSTASSGTNAYNYNFNTSAINPQNSNNRYNGFSVRCIAK